MPFQENSREIVSKFRQNFSKLREFMEGLDKKIGDLKVFNEAPKTVDGDELQ